MGDYRYSSPRKSRSTFIWGAVIFIVLILGLGYLFSANQAWSQEAPAPAVAGSPVDVGGGTQVNPEEAPPPEENDAVPTDDLLATETVVVTAEEAVRAPWGNWVAAYADLLKELAYAAIALIVPWLLLQLPKPLGDILRTARADQLLGKAADYAINATAGAVKGKNLDFSTGNVALDKGVQYVIDNAPDKLVAWLGGPAGVRQKIMARLPFDESVSADRGGLMSHGHVSTNAIAR